METILYVGAPAPQGDPISLLALGETRRLADGSLAFTSSPTTSRTQERCLLAVSSAETAASYLRAHRVDAVVIDTRGAPFGETSASEEGPFEATRSGLLLAQLFPKGSRPALVRRDRIVAIVSNDVSGVRTAHKLGTSGVGVVLVAPTREQLLERLEEFFLPRRIGRIAVCLAGGGIEGLLYELGVLRAIETFLVDRPLVDLDLFCGISAGAVLGAWLANGVGPEEIVRGLSGKSARIDPIRRSDLFDPNVKEIGKRAGRLLFDWTKLGAREQRMTSSLSSSVPSGIFAGDRLRAWLERQLTRPGMNNHFGDLRRPLFIGATDQDTSQAVVFGEKGFDHVPVHRAVRASSALIPFYAPEEIDGRYYIDGAFSRTTNMRVAVRQGATLVLLIDPLVPLHSDHAGYVYDRGGPFGTMQALKALVNARFDKAVRALRGMYPDVRFYLFRPEGDEMRMLAGSPMKYFYRAKVHEAAFQSAVAKIRTWLPEMTRDFALHGVKFADPDAPAVERARVEPFEPKLLGVA